MNKIGKLILVFCLLFAAVSIMYIAQGAVNTECSDHIDNDGDGFCDYKKGAAFCSDGSILKDTKCSSRNDDSELGNVNPCNVLFSNGNPNNSVNMIFVASNFGTNFNAFSNNVSWVQSVFGNYIPLNHSLINYFYVTYNKGDYCNFNTSGIERLLTCDNTIAKKLASYCSVKNQQIIVIHNDPTYGGSGNKAQNISVTSINIRAPQVVVHELGHSLFDLGDEYDVGSSNPTNSQNCDNSGCSKWSDLLGFNGVNCQPISCQEGLYFTSEITIMRNISLGTDFKFEEVNERLACCAFKRSINQYPLYCEKFVPFNLNSFCVQQSLLRGKKLTVPEDSYEYATEEGMKWHKNKKQ